MTWFWISGAALAAAALALLLRPLVFSRKGGKVRREDANLSIYKDQLAELDADLAAGKLDPADHARSRAELEARLLADVAAPEAGEAAVRPGGRRLTLALGAAVPLLAAVLYFAVGSPGSLQPGAEPHAFDTQQLATLVERLAAKMRENPDDPEGWRLLGRSYGALGRFPESVDAYAKALERKPRDPDLLADMADALAMMRPERLQGEPEKLVLRALEIDPEHLKALALAGTAAFERKDYARAERYWRRMLPLVAAGSEDERQIRGSIEEARSLAGGPPPAAAAARALQGKVSLSKKLAAQAAPDDVVFIFARAAEGPPMPLAVKRARVRDLPLEFALDDSMAMAPGMNLSAHARVVIGARISKSGTATPQPGDLQGLSAPVANDARGVSVTIDSVVR